MAETKTEDQDLLVGSNVPKPLTSGSKDVPCSNPIIKCQAPMQAALKPALWTPYLRSLHRAKPRSWTFKFPSTDEHLIIITEALEETGLIVQPYKTTNYGFEIRGFAFTPLCGWLDVVTLEVYVGDDSQDIQIKAFAGATGFVPLIVPAAPLLNILCCWMPFTDFGNCNGYLNSIYKNIKALI